MKKQYSCQIYNAKKAFVYFISGWIVSMAAITYLSLQLNAPYIPLIAFILWIILPFVYLKQFRNYFTKNVLLTFDENHFSITISKLEDDEVVNKIVFKWENIRSYKFYFTPSKLCYLNIFFRKGRFREFGFKEDKTQEEAIKEESVFSIFRRYVNQYNSDKAVKDRILLSPGFLTTKAGTVILVLVGLSMVFATIFYSIHTEKFSPFFIVGLCSFLPLLGKRWQDKKFYDMVKNSGDKAFPTSL